MSELVLHPTRLHMRKHGFRIVKPSAPLVRYWWGRVSRELWDGNLPQPTKISIRPDRKHWAWVAIYNDRPGEFDLEMDDYPLVKKRFIEVLTHESVHAHLWVAHGDNRTVHGPAFMQFRHRIKRTYGLKLGKDVNV